MVDDVFSNWPSTSMPDSRTSNGGQQTPKDLPYDPPVGPSGIMGNQRPGLGGTNHGNNGTQGRH